ncbi:MAG: SDR family NAD(P)-dependent oxidoreductase [Spirochaetaceae bacterium]|nr:SDR family NAD(P)-dependent oxidoreductase [Spirochaetaceae bacterium]
MEKIFDGRNALVIGGTGGLGRAVALGLALRGARLTIQGGGSRERLEGTLAALREAGAEAEGFLYDLADPVSAAGLLRRSPPPDILVCAWGPYKRCALEELRPEDWVSLTANNLILPGVLISAVLPGMIRRNWGRVLLFGGTNTDSIRGFATTAAYSAAKTALGVLAKSVALTAGPQGVSCNVICPGLVDTEYADEAVRAYNRERSPGGKALSPDEIAGFALRIMEHPQVNGAVIPIDRGLKL